MARVRDRIVELTSALVAIPTHETEEVAQRLIASWLEGCGFDCELQEVAPGRPNLVAHRPGRGGVFLNSHADTHPPHAHVDPLTLKRDDGVIVGRGALDAKGQIAALIAAVEAERDARALVIVTCDEETGGKGSETVVFPDGPWSEHGGIVLEPTNFKICTAQSGNMDIHVAATAEPQHAFAASRTGSPVKAVLAAIEELDTCSFLAVDHPLLGRPVTNIGRISGGEHLWRKPARAEVAMTLGIAPQTDIVAAEDEVRSRLDDLGRRWATRDVAFLYEIVDRSAPVEIPAAQVPIAERLAAAMETSFTPAGMPSWTDAGNFYAHHQQPCVVFGAGDLGPAHSDREWVRVDDLVRLGGILRHVLRD